MTRPTFEFVATNSTPDDKSGVAVWRAKSRIKGSPEIVVRQAFSTFIEAMVMNKLIKDAWADGEKAGHERCKRNVIEVLGGWHD